MSDLNDPSPSPEELPEERQDYDENVTWTASLYSYVQCVFSALPGLTPPSFQAGLFSNVLTAFVMPNIQDLKVISADRSAHYQIHLHTSIQRMVFQTRCH